MMEQNEPRIGVGAVVLDAGKILLGKRRGKHGDGCWQLPGGHMEWFETVEVCCSRELFEETGLEVVSMHTGPWANAIFTQENRHYVTVFMIVTAVSGTSTLKEPDKCDGWEWFSFNALPEPLFLPLQQLVTNYDLASLANAPSNKNQ